MIGRGALLALVLLAAGEARAQLAMAAVMNPTPDYQEALNEVRMRLAVRKA